MAERPAYYDEPSIQEADSYRRRKATSVLAIVFTDIANSTSLREKFGEVAYEELRENYDRRFSEIVEGDDAGAVVKSTGDGALVVFAEPSIAVERCLEVQKQLGKHPHFKLRMGIDMGQVSVKSSRGIVKDVFGRHVNRAARIQGLSDPGHVLTSFHVFDCAVGWLRHTTIAWHNHGEAELKGFEGAISIHEVYDPQLSAPQHNAHFPAYDPPMASHGGYSLRHARPIKLNAAAWDQLYGTLREEPIEIYSPASITSDSPHAHYSERIRTIVSALMDLIPERPSILWVDDFPENNAEEHRLLNDAGCTLDLATSTQEAHDQLQRKRYLLVITDMGRGEQPAAGLDLIRWMRQQSIFAPTFV